MELVVEALQPHAEIVDAGERPVPVGQAELVVVVQVVRRRDDADEAAEAVLAQPDDLLLAADATMVVAVAAGTLADRELVLHDPREVARRDAEGPLPAEARRHQRSLVEDIGRPMLPRWSTVGRGERRVAGAGGSPAALRPARRPSTAPRSHVQHPLHGGGIGRVTAGRRGRQPPPHRPARERLGGCGEGAGVGRVDRLGQRVEQVVVARGAGRPAGTAPARGRVRPRRPAAGRISWRTRLRRKRRSGSTGRRRSAIAERRAQPRRSRRGAARGAGDDGRAASPRDRSPQRRGAG